MPRLLQFVLIAGLALSLIIGACRKKETDDSRAESAPALALPSAKEFTPADTATLGTLEGEIGLAPGQKPGPFEAQTAAGERVTGEQLLERAPLLVVFYRGGWCPYCNFQIRELAMNAERFAELGVTPVAISVDRIDGAALMRQAYEIPFPVLSDPDLDAHHAFLVVHEVGPEEYEKLKGYGIELDKWSGEQHHKIAVPALFVLDSNGEVRFSHAVVDYTVRPTAEQLLEVIRTLDLEGEG